MMQVVPRWKIVVTFADRHIELWMHDQFITNVLNAVAKMQFSPTGLEQPTRIDVLRDTP